MRTGRCVHCLQLYRLDDKDKICYFCKKIKDKR